jgi:hypothetical protein
VGHLALDPAQEEMLPAVPSPRALIGVHADQSGDAELRAGLCELGIGGQLVVVGDEVDAGAVVAHPFGHGAGEQDRAWARLRHVDRSNVLGQCPQMAARLGHLLLRPSFATGAHPHVVCSQAVLNAAPLISVTTSAA